MEDAFQVILDRLIPGGFLILGCHEKLPPGFAGLFERERPLPIWRFKSL